MPAVDPLLIGHLTFCDDQVIQACYKLMQQHIKVACAGGPESELKLARDFMNDPIAALRLVGYDPARPVFRRTSFFPESSQQIDCTEQVQSDISRAVERVTVALSMSQMDVVNTHAPDEEDGSAAAAASDPEARNDIDTLINHGVFAQPNAAPRQNANAATVVSSVIMPRAKL